jgi:hypothetical protein
MLRPLIAMASDGRHSPGRGLAEQMMSEGELVLSFCDYEIVLHGINLRELWKDLRERRLARVWELPADFLLEVPDQVPARPTAKSLLKAACRLRGALVLPPPLP